VGPTVVPGEGGVLGHRREGDSPKTRDGIEEGGEIALGMGGPWGKKRRKDFGAGMKKERALLGKGWVLCRKRGKALQCRLMPGDEKKKKKKEKKKKKKKKRRTSQRFRKRGLPFSHRKPPEGRREEAEFRGGGGETKKLSGAGREMFTNIIKNGRDSD